MDKVIIKKLREIRCRKNLSRVTLGIFSDISSKTIQRAEQGEEISVKSLNKIARGLNVAKEELL